MANYLLTEELKRLVVQVVNEHQNAFQPRGKRGRRVPPRPPEKYRLVRGVSYGEQSGPTILIDNIVALANGTDPTRGDRTAKLLVANIGGDRFSDGDPVDAVYNATAAIEWETLVWPGQLAVGAYRGVVASSLIPKATGIRNGPITPGTGFVLLYNPPADTTQPGTAWTPSHLVLAENWMFGDIKKYAPVLMRKSRFNVNVNEQDQTTPDGPRGNLYEIIAEGCTAVPDSEGGQR